MKEWQPFRPTSQDLKRVTQEVAPIAEIQAKLVANCPDLKRNDRVAHQYQIAGGKVELHVAPERDLPASLRGIGLFEPEATFHGVGRISTGQGCPHLETDPDFLGMMLAFQTKEGRRVDFLGINDPAAPTDTHREFVTLLDAAAESAGAEPLFGSGLGDLDLTDLLASNLSLVRNLVGSLGIKKGGGTALHVLKQTLRTARSATAYQTYWTGIVETGGTPGKFAIVPISDENDLRALHPGERYLTDEWRERQAKGPVTFHLYWLPFIDQKRTSLTDLTEDWEEQRALMGQVVFPQAESTGEEAQLWAALAAEMGVNPGNWVRDRDDTIPEPGTEFTLARKLAYRNSQQGRNVLPEETYAEVFRTGEIGKDLAEELKRRRLDKLDKGHVDTSPT